jgi:hypothetical protein
VEKLVYLLNKDPETSGDAVGHAVIERLVPALRSHGAYRILVNTADLTERIAREAPARIGGPWNGLGAVVSFWLDNLDARTKIEPEIAGLSASYAGYLVTESVVQPYQRSWVDGERRAGVTLFSALGKPAAATEEEFYYWWQVRHSASSFRLHPRRWSYIRNAVARPLTQGAPAYRAIVLEHFRDLAEFTDDSLLFGGEAALAEMYEELPHFCDADTMITGPMGEYSFAWELGSRP